MKVKINWALVMNRNGLRIKSLFENGHGFYLAFAADTITHKLYCQGLFLSCWILNIFPRWKLQKIDAACAYLVTSWVCLNAFAHIMWLDWQCRFNNKNGMIFKIYPKNCVTIVLVCLLGCKVVISWIWKWYVW